MNVDELRGWVAKGAALTAKGYGYQAKDFWPDLSIAGQGQTTTWAWATFLLGVCARFGNSTTAALEFSAHRGKDQHKAARRHVLEETWGGRKHHPWEIMVDFTVHDWHAPGPLLAAAESEVHPHHGVGTSITRKDDFSWDFYKLMLVRAPLRLFIARVGASSSESGTQRRDKLETSLGKLCKWYPDLIRGTEVGVVVLAEEYRRDEWQDSRVLVLGENGVIERGLVWP